jgi:putative ABC transport system permease protein
MLTLNHAGLLALGALRDQRRRTALIALASAIGVAAVLLLTGLGEGARRYVVNEFSALGTHLIVIFPGRNETVGGPPPMMGETPRDLTLADAEALRRVAGVRRVVPLMVGSANVSVASGLERETTLMGATGDLQPVRQLALAEGRFLPRVDASSAGSGCVLGTVLREEFFGDGRALGQWLRVGDRRCRVIGVLGTTGVSLGTNYNEVILMPLATAQAVMDTEALFRILVDAREGESSTAMVNALRNTLKRQHDGEDDITIITQDSVVATFDRLLGALTLGVAAVSAISMVVAGILVMNVMLVSVAQRRSEIGLLKALGAHPRDIRRLFLIESVLLSALGATLGLLAGQIALFVLRVRYPDFPAFTPWWGLLAALVTALGAGVVFGVGPARRAASLDPVAALSGRQ